MADLVTLQHQLAELRTHRASGVSTVRFADGREVSYKTDAQMAEAIADIEHRIQALRGCTVRVVRFTGSKGV